MFFNKKEKVASTITFVFRFSIVVISAHLLAACLNHKLQFMERKTKKEGTVLHSQKVGTEQNKSRRKGRGRLVLGKPYKIKGKWYYPKDDPTYRRIGQASWYGADFHGRLTANGEIYDMNLLTAAHPTMPLPSYARVTNLRNGASIVVRVNDRGPFIKDRIIDLSRQAAKMLGYVNSGVTNVEVKYIARALNDYDNAYLMASYKPQDSSTLLLTENISVKKKSLDFPIFSVDNQRRLVLAVTAQKKQIKSTFIKLPKVGPTSPKKPPSFRQVIFARIGSIFDRSNKE